MATAVTSMRIPTELNERYSRLAKETGRSRSFYVNEALQESIDRFEYEYGILKEGALWSGELISRGTLTRRCASWTGASPRGYSKSLTR